ncbi:hypothetical protein POTOM_006171 [Populus tomentosa]|uniref:Gamma-butyrobetaine hydroxylase-like N-terminal domain-containing protein n=1 Tax=Populus tomentosa TaxID=118781 RepID=A0A8X8AIM6_POPTO|nr:hypothetical protein POTOM_006171 [Populus tomentosa]
MLAIQKAIRRVHTSLDAPRLTRFTLQAPKYFKLMSLLMKMEGKVWKKGIRIDHSMVEVEYANGSKFNLSAEFLRIHSPAVDGKVRSVGGEKVIVGRRHVGIMSAEPVGNYGVRYLRLNLCVRIFILVYADANFSHKRALNVKYGDGVIWVDDSG